MKKTIVLILASLLAIFLLTACGGGGGTQDTTAEGTTAETTTTEVTEATEAVETTVAEETTEIAETEIEQKDEKADEIINIDPHYIAIDDDNIMMEITSVSKEYKNKDTEDEWISYKVNFTVTNKMQDKDVEVSVAVGAASVGSYTVNFGNMNTRTQAGKINDTACYTCTVYPNSPEDSTEGAEHIESLEDLLQFEASVEVSPMDENEVYDRYNVDISLANQATAETSEDTDSEKVPQLSVGDLAETDVVEMTLDSSLFGRKLALGSENPDNYHMPTDETKGLAAGDGYTYFIFDFTVKNVAKEAISGSDICGMDSKNKSSLWTLDYNDGYIYDNGDYADLDLVVGGNYNYNPIMDPLSTSHFRGIIKCIEEVETNESEPLLLHVILPTSNGTQAFDYKIR